MPRSGPKVKHGGDNVYCHLRPLHGGSESEAGIDAGSLSHGSTGVAPLRIACSCSVKGNPTGIMSQLVAANDTCSLFHGSVGIGALKIACLYSDNVPTDDPPIAGATADEEADMGDHAAGAG